jgi:thiosulfate reductase cytochrome b subunit
MKQVKRTFIYPIFERFWHWSQAALIIVLGLSGFEVHGSYRLFGFGNAVSIHNTAAILLLILVAFTIFWHFVTGQWKQYVPTTKNLGAVIRYYAIGIFKHEPHPVRRTRYAKLNPLQKLVYLGFKLLIFPIMATTGLLYMFSNTLGVPISPVAFLHVLGAFLLLSFFIVHLYMVLTTGRTPLAHLKPMITGWEELEEETGEAPQAAPQPSGD